MKYTTGSRKTGTSTDAPAADEAVGVAPPGEERDARHDLQQREHDAGDDEARAADRQAQAEVIRRADQQADAGGAEERGARRRRLGRLRDRPRGGKGGGPAAPHPLLVVLELLRAGRTVQQAFDGGIGDDGAAGRAALGRKRFEGRGPGIHGALAAGAGRLFRGHWLSAAVAGRHQPPIIGPGDAPGYLPMQ
jgi:hypothetical protein